MTRSRIAHSATLLLDGRVLIAGGEPTGSAEIYDPDSGTFAETGGMASVRYSHSAVLLRDGRVLVVGGCGEACVINAELYNPGTEQFTATGRMSVAQDIGAAVLLRNGKVLVVGNLTAELFDPAFETFAPVGKGGTASSATLLSDGTVLLIGGTEPSLKGGAEASIFDPATNQFRSLSCYCNLASTSAALLEGSVLFAAGGDLPYYPASWWTENALYDPATHTFKLVQDMPLPHHEGTVTLLKDGRVLIAGGFHGEGPPTFSGIFDSAEIYDPPTQTFYSLAQKMVLHRQGHTATLLRDGRVLITGGRTAHSNWPPVDDTLAELFVPESTQGTVPRLSIDRTRYCVGDAWFLQAEAVMPFAAVQISGIWDETPWTVPIGTSGEDGTLVARGTFGVDTIGNYLIWIRAGEKVFPGGKVSNTVSLSVENCSARPD
jgi:hypothetical protein